MIGRLAAVNELKVFSNDKSVLIAWTKVATRDTFWAVRKAAIENIGKYPNEKSVELFKNCLKDQSSKVRQSAIHLLADLKDPKMVKLFENVFKSENSYAVQAESLISIGKIGGKRQLAFLKLAETRRSYRDVVSKAAREAIGMIMKK